MRFLEIFSHKNKKSDYTKSVEAFPEVTFRSVIEPRNKIGQGALPISFDAE